MNTHRLKILADFLLTIPVDRFDLADWRHSPEYHSGLTDEDLINPTCNTTGCAIGWACTMPEFQKEGLYWESSELFPGFFDGKTIHENWNAVTEFFGLDYERAYHIFGAKSISYHTPHHVAERTKIVIAEHFAEKI